MNMREREAKLRDIAEKIRTGSAELDDAVTLDEMAEWIDEVRDSMNDTVHRVTQIIEHMTDIPKGMRDRLARTMRALSEQR